MSDNVGDDARSADAVAIRLSERDWKKDAWRELKKAPFTAKFGLLIILIYVFVFLAVFLAVEGLVGILRGGKNDRAAVQARLKRLSQDLRAPGDAPTAEDTVLRDMGENSFDKLVNGLPNSESTQLLIYRAGEAYHPRKLVLTSIGLAVVGVQLMAAGWYAEYFETYDLRDASFAPDTDPAGLVGAYHAFAPRIVPLIFAALFGAHWLGAAYWLRGRPAGPDEDRLRPWAVPLAVVGAVFLHVSACALLYDRPLPLGIAVVLVGAASILALGRLEATRWLMIPLGLSLLGIAGIGQNIEGTEQSILLALIAVWAVAYAVAFLRAKPAEALTVADGVRTQAALLGFGALALVSLLPSDRVDAAALSMTLAGLAAAYVAVRARQASLLIAAELVAGLGLLLVALVSRADLEQTWHPAGLALAAVWTAGHVAAVWRLPASKSRRTTGLVALCLALLGGLRRRGQISP